MAAARPFFWMMICCHLCASAEERVWSLECWDIWQFWGLDFGRSETHRNSPEINMYIYIHTIYKHYIYIYIHAIYTYTILWIPLAPKIIGMLKTSEDPIWPCAMPPGQARGGSHFPWWPQRQCPGVSGTGRWFVCLSGCCPQWSGGYVSS